MADALLSPATGAALWTATAATTVHAARRVRAQNDAARIPVMGVTGAFVFAAQMLNFQIPGTGSSGHLGGGLLLAVLLGPEAALLVMTSVLAVQALFFADGGLLALGANAFNLGFVPAFIAYPLVYRPVAGDGSKPWRVVAGALLGGIVALQLGAFGVVLQTVLSGVGRLPFSAFLVVMQPIHLVIGVVEGLVTAGVLLFVSRAEPQLLVRPAERSRWDRLRLKPVIAGFAVAALIAVGVLAGVASEDPDGLEWSIARVAGEESVGEGSALHRLFAGVQAFTAVLPGYGSGGDGTSGQRAGRDGRAADGPDAGAEGRSPKPVADTTAAGALGAGIVGLAVFGVGYVLARRRRLRRDP